MESFWVFVFCKRHYVPLPCVGVLKKPWFSPVWTEDWSNGVLSSMLTMLGSPHKAPCESSLYSCSSFILCFLSLGLPLFPCICLCFLPWPLSLHFCPFLCLALTPAEIVEPKRNIAFSAYTSSKAAATDHIELPNWSSLCTFLLFC